MKKEHRELSVNLKTAVKKMHSNLAAEPQMKRLGATKKTANDSLPKSGAGFGLRRAEGGKATEEDLVVMNKRRGGHLKRAMGGPAEEQFMEDTRTDMKRSKGGRTVAKESMKLPARLRKKK